MKKVETHPEPQTLFWSDASGERFLFLTLLKFLYFSRELNTTLFLREFTYDEIDDKVLLGAETSLKTWKNLHVMYF